MTCKEICYQQWVDNYNKKDKECFDLQLKCSKLEQKLEKIKEYCIPDLMFTECMKTILRIIENEVIK